MRHLLNCGYNETQYIDVDAVVRGTVHVLLGLCQVNKAFPRCQLAELLLLWTCKPKQNGNLSLAESQRKIAVNHHSSSIYLLLFQKWTTLWPNQMRNQREFICTWKYVRKRFICRMLYNDGYFLYISYWFLILLDIGSSRECPAQFQAPSPRSYRLRVVYGTCILCDFISEPNNV